MTDGVGAALTGLRFVNNGDGTVTDNQTGLQWEQKVTGRACPHCVDDVYTWTSGSTEQPPPSDLPDDGTAFTMFLSELNTCGSQDGISVTGGFAGHCDWRLPTIVELRSIIDLSAIGCGVGSVCIDPIFGPTAISGYWSSSEQTETLISAWGGGLPHWPAFRPPSQGRRSVRPCGAGRLLVDALAVDEAHALEILRSASILVTGSARTPAMRSGDRGMTNCRAARTA